VKIAAKLAVKSELVLYAHAVGVRQTAHLRFRKVAQIIAEWLGVGEPAVH